MPKQPEKFITYCLSIAQEFQARLSRMQVFAKHNLSSGTANEVILREFLASHAPGDFAVDQGFICDPTESDKVSKQCDILVYDRNHFPLVYSDGSVKIVWPLATRMVIEVKTNFRNREEIYDALHNIESARSLNRQIVGIIFAFNSASLITVFKHLAKYTPHVGDEYKPTAIVLLDQGVIIHQWSIARYHDKENRPETDLSAYAVRQGDKENRSSMAMAFLLLFFFEVVGRGRGLFSDDVISMTIELLEKHTIWLSDEYIGKNE
jgi:hypothetical protein